VHLGCTHQGRHSKKGCGGVLRDADLGRRLGGKPEVRAFEQVTPVTVRP
jgi:hypothetical protein